MEEKSDIQLVIQARQGDKEAFGQLALRYQLMAYRFALRLVAESGCAQELVQEALLQAYLSLDRLHDPARFRGWLCGIVLNVCRSYLQDRKLNFFSLEAMAGGLQFEAVPLVGPDTNPEKMAEERELHNVVLEAISTLSSSERDVTLGFYYEQLSVKEIAALKGIKMGAVKVRLHRARQRLKTRLLEHYPDIVLEEKGRKKMIKMSIADVVKQERKDAQGSLIWQGYVIMLQDETGKRALPIWIGPFEGQSIARALSNYPSPRPMTFNFFAKLLEAIDARVEQVRIESLKGDTFYAVVRIRCGQIVKEVDARPSDALALATLIGSPVYAAEDVVSAAGEDIPSALKVSERRGVEGILKEIGEMQRQMQVYPLRPMSKEEQAKARAELIEEVFRH